MAQQKPVHSIGVVLKDGLDKVTASNIVRRIVDAGLQVYTLLDDLSSEGAIKVSDVNDLKSRVDVVVSVGGDGTLLRTLRLLRDETPVLAVNVGHRGILSEIKPKELDEALLKLKKGEYLLDRRMRLVARTSVELPPATNEVYVVRKRHIGTPLFTIRLGETQISVRMDGVVVSTPTGSTGHAYSLKGPVLQEDLDGVLIVPASPLQHMPPIVVKPQPITIKVDQPADVVVDGQEVFGLESGEGVEISRYKYDANLVRLGGFAFKQLLKMIS
ncbi:MAG: NAD(+)/NADH kinase [Thaumarchaeota archaeon]|nr:NAD(+)/NADH kinase [Nitrososphaerota archaeon]